VIPGAQGRFTNQEGISFGVGIGIAKRRLTVHRQARATAVSRQPERD
jgi:hypothetical protein